ncbi:MAG: NAD-dependent epimerase/dehydratase family protein [Actinomycetota bacterium]|nr:NAD-dependent epimerase/dehydratase family protein [Actinomycetota bacterium]
MGRNVLVTGVSRELAARHARALALDPDVTKVIGVDEVPPRRGIDGVRFVRADIRNPVIGKVLAVEDIDTVVHLAVASSSAPGARTSMKESNVIGSMQLLAACQRSAGVRKLVLKSSTSVYGASPRDPAMFSEEMGPKRSPRSGFAKDCVEVEGYVRGFARRRPDVLVTNLRLANVLSPLWDTSMSSYLRLPVLPTVLGFDPRLQVVHPEDVLESLRRAVVHDAAGTFNVAGPGVLVLSQVLRRLGRRSVPIPSFAFAKGGSTILTSLRSKVPGDLVQLLVHGRGVDLTALTAVFGYRPRHTSAATLDAFLLGLPRGSVSPQRVRDAQTRLQDRPPCEKVRSHG